LKFLSQNGTTAKWNKPFLILAQVGMKVPSPGFIIHCPQKYFKLRSKSVFCCIPEIPQTRSTEIGSKRQYQWQCWPKT
jgi:hypothetical protein